jgi:predicted O-methyltransferase YrrM
VRAVLPKPVRQRLRQAHRTFLLSRSVHRFVRLPQDADPPDSLWRDMVYGWGNDGYSAQHEYLAAVLRHARAGAGPVLECGSGLSTLVLGLALRHRARAVWSLEHDPVWAERTSARLRSYGVETVDLYAAELRSYGSYTWYQPPLDRMPSDFALVVCDGPPGGTAGGRYGLLPIMRSRLAAGCVILLDDVERLAEQKTIETWVKEFGIDFRVEGKEKPFATIRVPGADLPRSHHALLAATEPEAQSGLHGTPLAGYAPDVGGCG